MPLPSRYSSVSPRSMCPFFEFFGFCRVARLSALATPILGVCVVVAFPTFRRFLRAMFDFATQFRRKC